MYKVRCMWCWKWGAFVVVSVSWNTTKPHYKWTAEILQPALEPKTLGSSGIVRLCILHKLAVMCKQLRFQGKYILLAPDNNDMRWDTACCSLFQWSWITCRFLWTIAFQLWWDLAQGQRQQVTPGKGTLLLLNGCLIILWMTGQTIYLYASIPDDGVTPSLSSTAGNSYIYGKRSTGDMITMDKQCFYKCNCPPHCSSNIVGVAC